MKKFHLSASLLLGSIWLAGLLLSLNSCKDNGADCSKTVWYEDADGDGLGNAAKTQTACNRPTGYVANGSDTDATTHVSSV